MFSLHKMPSHNGRINIMKGIGWMNNAKIYFKIN